MKCTSKSERRRQRNKNLLMGMGVVIVVLLIVLAVVLIKKKDASMPISFDLTTEVFGQTVEEEALTADGLAADLCVGAGDTALDGVETQGDERAALFDIQNKTLLFSKSLYEKSYPASITKIMTALVAMEHADMDEVVTITASDVALSADSQVCGLAEGDQIQMSELFHALLVYSANDAAMAIARTVGDGSVDTFVQMMNDRAAQLGCTNTVYDIYLMLNEAMKHQEFTDITQLSNYTITYTSADGTQRQKWLDATDQYLTGESSAPKGVTILGGKTGTTDKAGACLALMVQNNYGEPYVSIVLDASNKPELYERMNQLLEKVNHS